ncbi:FkbM family methyltransferase [Candidatus Omnitrophota bacterium]
MNEMIRYENFMITLINILKNTFLYSLFVHMRDKLCAEHKISRDIKVANILQSLKEGTYFIQVGACDGITCDPIHSLIIQNNWSGILIEPVKYYFDQLKSNYNGMNNLIFENVFIGENNIIRDFYYIDSNVASEMNGEGPHNNWAYGQGSFSKEVITREIKSNAFRGKWYRDNIPRFISSIRSIKVPSITINDLIKKYAPQKVDLLQIDAQGFDYNIIKSIDFDLWKPKIINFESSMFPKEKKSCNLFLKKKGYAIIEYGCDMLAVLNETGRAQTNDKK